jgi:hypothetical protein
MCDQQILRTQAKNLVNFHKPKQNVNIPAFEPYKIHPVNARRSKEIYLTGFLHKNTSFTKKELGLYNLTTIGTKILRKSMIALKPQGI